MSTAQTRPKMVMHKAIPKKVNAPLQGGVDTFPSGDIVWTHGDPYDNSIKSPAAHGCYHAMEPDKAEKVEGKYLQSLVESRCLKPISTDKPSQKQVPLIQWMKDIQAHLVTNGMDGVFYGVDTKNKVVLNLLESWSKTMIMEVAKWVKAKPWDYYD